MQWGNSPAARERYSTMTSPRASADLFSLDGHVGIVTGGAGRLGRQYAAALSSAGAAVALFDIVAPAANLQERLDADARLSSHVVDTTDRAADASGSSRSATASRRRAC